ncbi:hypothetical protein GHT09_008342 [Marmota monax]|uniref:Uncharacterized protein n=1 Tax=Marmota monax TaxID=9995 RepID=A0A834QP98_MARMO|nr:hypothetical protein GHT09_008342 [Marmota monax]
MMLSSITSDSHQDLFTTQGDPAPRWLSLPTSPPSILGDHRPALQTWDVSSERNLTMCLDFSLPLMVLGFAHVAVSVQLLKQIYAPPPARKSQQSKTPGPNPIEGSSSSIALSW